MKINRKIINNISISILTASVFILLSKTVLFQQLDLLGLDTLFRIRGPVKASSKIVIIEINDENIYKIGRWPWDRSWIAKMTKALKFFKAKQICFDLLMNQPSSAEDDDFLSKEIKAAGNVYLPYVFNDLIFDNEIAILKPIDKFYRYLKGTGFVNVKHDVDGRFRRVSLFFKDDGTDYIQWSLQLAMDYLGLRPKNFSNHSLILAGNNQTVKIPLIEDNKSLINWLGPWREEFVVYSFLDVLNAYYDSINGKIPKIDVNSFKDKICLVGVTSIGLYDVKPNPFDPSYPGLGMIATVLDNIISNRYIKYLPWWINIAFIYLMSLIPALLNFEDKPIREIFSLIAIVLIIFISYVLFEFGYIFSYLIPIFSVFTSYSIISAYNFIVLSYEKKRFFELAITDDLTGLYNMRYFKMILETQIMISKVDRSKNFCIVLCDVDDFKSFNDSYGHQMGDLILSHISRSIKSSVRMLDVVARYGGEEIIILLRGVSLNNAIKVAETIRKNIENLTMKEMDNISNLTISLGVSNFDFRKDDERSIIKRADDALYEAKRSGKNKVRAAPEPL